MFGIELQDLVQGIEQFYQGHEGLINIIGSLVIPIALGAIWAGIWWYRTQKRKIHFPLDNLPFEIVEHKANVLSVVFDENNSDPLSDARIPYQTRQADRSIRRELEQKLEEEKWLLIVGRNGLGKTREAAELAQLYQKDGWTVLWLKPFEWVDEPTIEQLLKIGTHHKLLFFLDNLNQKMDFGRRQVSPRAEKSELAPLNIPLQLRLLRALEAFERLFGQDQMRVIATARNERESLYSGQQSEWEKLQWEKYPLLWQRFKVFELSEPEDEAIVQLLNDIVPQTNLSAREQDYELIAQKNDCTFRNVIENLSRLKNRGKSLTPNNYCVTLTANWRERYRNAVKRVPGAKYIYDAVDLLGQFGIVLERFTVEPAALLIVRGNFWQWLWYRCSIPRALNYLIEVERILSPRDGQIEAKPRQVEASKYVRPLCHKVLKLSDKYPQLMRISLFNFGWQLSYLNRPREALASFDKIISFTPDIEIPDLWGMRGVALGNLGRYEKALASFDKALEFKPDYDQAWYNKAACYAFQNNIELALENLKKAINLNPEYREWAKTDPGFDSIRENKLFQKLILD